MGPEMRFWYLVTAEWAQVQGFWESLNQPQGQGYTQKQSYFLFYQGRLSSLESAPLTLFLQLSQWGNDRLWYLYPYTRFISR